MIEKSKLYIKKRSLSEIMVFLVFIIPLISQLFIEALNFPSAVKYVIDAILIVFTVVFLAKRTFSYNKALNPFSFIIFFFLIYTFLVYVFNFQSPFYYFWGIRNYFRFYVAFFVFIIVLNKNKAESYLDILDKLFWVNAIICAVQIILGYRQDYLGGLFGIEKGCNASIFVFLTIVIAKSLLQFMNGKEKISLCLLKSGVALIISAFAELKIFFFVFVVIVILATLLTSFSWKKVIFLLISAILVSISSTILVLMFDYFAGFFSLEALITQLTLENYASENDIGRFSALSSISERFLPTIPDQLFGMGLGNCDTSAIDIFNTDFYVSHVDSHYSIFSHAFLFIETGVIGLIAYCTFFVVSLINSIRGLRSNTKNKLFCQLAIIMSVMCFILLVYNSSLRTDIAYLVYFILALPYVDMDKNFENELQMD